MHQWPSALRAHAARLDIFVVLAWESSLRAIDGSIKPGAIQKCLYLVTRSLDPTGAGRTRWDVRWKPALNAFAITFSDRFPAAENY
ncbi:MAG: family transposase [Acidimicrobiales bacterium]|nr:family transposase [Acidimicrobiales bacterium]